MLAQVVGKKMQRLANACRSGVVVLHYHRISHARVDPHHVNVTPEHFAEHMEAIRAIGPVLSLDQLTQLHAAGRLPRRGFAVTFDDGYLNNLLCAAPILERLGIPATVFVSTGMVGQQQGYWWDRLWRSIAMAAQVSPALQLSAAGKTLRLILKTGEMDERLRLNHDCHEILLSMDDESRDALLAKIEQWGQTEHLPWEDMDLPMGAEHLRQITRSGLISLGGHSCSHRRLVGLSLEEARRETAGCREKLQFLAGVPINTFAYPFGWRGTDYDQRAVDEVREAGYAAAFCSNPTPVRKTSCRFEMPRLWVDDCDGDALSASVRMWSRL